MNTVLTYESASGRRLIYIRSCNMICGTELNLLLLSSTSCNESHISPESRVWLKPRCQGDEQQCGKDLGEKRKKESQSVLGHLDPLRGRFGYEKESGFEAAWWSSKQIKRQKLKMWPWTGSRGFWHDRTGQGWVNVRVSVISVNDSVVCVRGKRTNRKSDVCISAWTSIRPRDSGGWEIWEKKEQIQSWLNITF